MGKLYEFIDKPLSGEWGDEDKDGIGTLVLRTTNFTNIGLVDFDNVVTRIIPHKKLKDKYLRNGDIIIEKSGGSPNQPVGRVIYFEGEENKYTFNNFTSVLRVKNIEEVFSKYVFYTLFHYYRIGKTRTFQNKTTGILNLKLDRYIKEIDIEFPSLDEQKEIAQTLELASELIALRKKQLAELDNLIKSTFFDMFGDPVVNEKGWEKYVFSDVAIIDTRMTKEFEKYSDVPHIGIDCIEKDSGKILHYKLIKDSGLISGKYIFDDRHIIYSKIRPNLNKVAMPDFSGLCSADAYPILPVSGKVNKYYLAYILRSEYFLSYILEHSDRTNIPKVNKQQLQGFLLPVPPIFLQKQFAQIVTKIEEQKSLVQKALDESQYLFDSLMSEYFE